MKIYTKSKCLLLVAIVFFSCSGEQSANDPPSIIEVLNLKTFEANDIMPTTAVVSSFIKSDTEKFLKSRGVCYNTVGNPTINDLKVENSESLLGPYSTLLTGLQQDSRFYAKLYAISNSGSIYYGNEISFQTSKIIIVSTEFITYEATNVTSNSAILGAVVVKNGNLLWNNLKLGICFSSTNKIPNISDSAVYSKTEVTEPFRISAKNLNSKTSYYFRPFASSLDGTEVYYGDIQSFTTNNSN